MSLSKKGSFSLRDAYMEKVRPGNGREAGLGHEVVRATQEQLPRKRG